MQLVRRFTNSALLVAIVGSVLAFSSPSSALGAVSSESFEMCLLDKINTDRAELGVGVLEMALDLNPQARDWSEWMRHNDFRHMNSAERAPILPDDWTTWAENIAYRGDPNQPDCSQIHAMFMNSPGHRSNILNVNQRFVALGAYVDSSGWWVTELFFASPGYSPACAGTFCDDDGSAFEASIERLAASGLTAGCNTAGDMFCPNAYVTRGQMAAFLTRGLGYTARLDDPFTDDDDSIFEASIEAIAAAGVTVGCNTAGDMFCPESHVTRGQMAALLRRALESSMSVDLDDADTFDDIADSLFADDIAWLSAARITSGCNANSFCPAAKVTRGQMAAFLDRGLNL